MEEEATNITQRLVEASNEDNFDKTPNDTVGLGPKLNQPTSNSSLIEEDIIFVHSSSIGTHGFPKKRKIGSKWILLLSGLYSDAKASNEKHVKDTGKKKAALLNFA